MTLKEKLEAGRFVLTAELGPPRSASGKSIRRKAAHFRGLVDGVNITDNQTSIVRLSSIASARILIDEGLEPVIQMTCRDRNRIALQSDLLGAAALGVSNLLCLTGDFMRFGDHPESRPVFDLDSIQLIAAARRMNEGYFLSGDKIKTPPRLFIGAAANPFAEPREFRVMRLAKKIRAGARFIQTQPVYDIECFRPWMSEARDRGLHEKTAILAGVMPVKSVKALDYMENEVPGMRIPEEIRRRMRTAADPAEEGARIAVESIRELKEIKGVRGIHLMPLMWESIIPRIAEEAGLKREEEPGSPGRYSI